MKTDEEYSSKEDDIEYYFSINLKMLRITGLKCQLNEKIERHYRFSDRIVTYFFNFWGFFIAATQIYYLIDVFSYDTSTSMKIVTQLLSNFQCISKGFRMASAVNILQTALQELGTIWKKYRPKKELRPRILKEAYSTFLFSVYYIIAVYITNIFYDIPPMRNYVYQYLTRKETNITYEYIFIILAKHPFEIKNITVYTVLLLEQQILLLMSSVYWLNSDSLFAQLTTHITLQLKILKHDLGALIDCEEDNDILKKNILIIVKRHRELLRLCNLTEEVFSPIVFTTILFSSINICINVFEVRETIGKGLYEESGIYLFLTVITTFQIVFFCVFAESLAEETSSIADSIYNCKWTEKDYRLRFYLQLIISRAQRPFYCTAYGFFTIGHQRLTSIINTSFSYYMMLQTVGG